MKKLLLILAALLAFGFRARSQQNCIPVISTHESELAYKSGERASYTMHYKFGVINTDVAIAKVALDTVRVGGVKAFQCKVYGETAGIFKRLFHVAEDFQSWFSCEGVTPLRFYRNSVEGSYRSVNNYTYIWDAEKPYIDAQVYNTIADSTKVMQIPLKACTFDLPSLYYFARNIDLNKIEKEVKYPMTFAIDDEVFDVYYIYKGRVTKRIPGLGNVKCLLFKAKLLAGGVFKGDKDMDIYVSDDLNRVPLFFSAEIALGEAQGRLTEISGLKYPKSWEK